MGAGAGVGRFGAMSLDDGGAFGLSAPPPQPTKVAQKTIAAKPGL
jgi:hypothetical protein